MTVRDECIAELRRAGAIVTEGFLTVLVRLPNGGLRELENWLFNLRCYNTHEATRHACQLKRGSAKEGFYA